MDQKAARLYPSASSEKDDLEQRLEKKLNGVNCSSSHINNIKEMITYFKDKNNKSIEKYKKDKTITTILKSFDTFAIIATTSSSVTLSFTGIGLMAIPTSTSVACGLTISNKVIYEIIINKYNNNKKQYERDQQTMKSFDKLYRKSLQDNVIDKSEFESLCNISINYVDEMKIESFLQIRVKKQN